MNPINTFCCRTFQTAFQAALPFLPYRKPHKISSVKKLPDILSAHGCGHVLIVTDRLITGLGLTRSLEQALRDHKIAYTLYDRTVANPTTANVEEARTLFLQKDCDAIIGFGGGSSMDCAKAVGARIAQPRKSLARMKGILRVHRRLPLLIAVPTTAGTGSETTLASVITDSRTRRKYAISDFPLIPRYAVLDPRLTVSLPPFITATTGLDALTHAVEAYIGRSTTRDTRRAALTAVRLIFPNLDRAYAKGSDLKARRGMLAASFHAGYAFSKSYVGYIHAVAHSLGGEYGTPHGLANAILLPHFLDAYGPAIYRKLHYLAVAAGVADLDTPDETAARAFVQAIRDMERRFRLPKTLPEICLADIPKLARYADHEANPLYPVPVLMNARELEAFYHKVAQ